MAQNLGLFNTPSIYALTIPLDIFCKSQHNKNIRNKRDAWLTLFSNDDPDIIISLIETYPEFRKIYEEAYRLCLNIERVMDMFSEELAILDRNTVKYMMDEMQSEIDDMKSKIGDLQGTIEKQANELKEIDEKHIKTTISILRSLNLPESEIISQISNKYHITEEQVRQCL